MLRGPWIGVQSLPPACAGVNPVARPGGRRQRGLGCVALALCCLLTLLVGGLLLLLGR